MQITSTLPSQSCNSFHLERLTFHCKASAAADKTKLHLRNLDNLLCKNPVEATQMPHRVKLPCPPEEVMSTHDHSPRNRIAAKWREYHGRHNWSALLDPLDENLRREVVRYGEFVQSAYAAYFHGDSGHRKVALPDRNYKVTKSLYATSSIGLPTWLDDVMATDLRWMTQRSSWIGYVAVCDDPLEISRMGRRDIVIALRGTATCLEWAENFRDKIVHVADPAHRAKVGLGFLSLFKTRGEHVSSLAEAITKEVGRLMEQYKGETLSITVTGHSLGAALALLVADSLSSLAGGSGPPIAVFSFGGPRVGNRAFAERIEEKGVRVLRVVNTKDVVTRLPGLVEVDGRRGVARGIRRAVEEWSYAHVGAELRVEMSMSPYLKGEGGVVRCHDLEAYLHLVDGHSGSGCEFRRDAKRKLVKKKAGKLVVGLDVERGSVVGFHDQMSSCLPSP